METAGLLVIAIDGPAASGKSTVAISLARRLGLSLIDSGSMYRAVTLHAVERNVPLEEPDALLEIARWVSDNFRLEMEQDGATRVFLGEREVTRDIRSPAVGEAVSPVSAVGSVREEMVRLQRSLVGGRGAVVEGRDIGTTVFPDAALKVFLEAPASERARRRFEELREKGISATETDVESEIAMRDSIDSSREHSPLAKAPDAVLMDTSGISVEQVVDRVVSALEEKGLLQ